MVPLLDDVPFGETTASTERHPFSDADVLGDPRVLALYLDSLVEQHHQLGGGQHALCACGEPYATCAVARRIRDLRPPPTPTDPSHWFG